MMEAASFLLLEKTTTYKTRDFLDFYVEHLSWYERRLIVATNPLEQREKVLGAARRALATKLEAMTFRQKQRPLDAVAVMPFYGQGQGQGPSSVGLRGIYLNATLNSVRAALTRTVVVAVHNEQDLEFVETCIGLCGSTSRRWRGAPEIRCPHRLRPAGRRPVSAEHTTREVGSGGAHRGAPARGGPAAARRPALLARRDAREAVGP